MHQPQAQTRAAGLENPGDGWKPPHRIHAERADFFKVVDDARPCFSDSAVNPPCRNDDLQSADMQPRQEGRTAATFLRAFPAHSFADPPPDLTFTMKFIALTLLLLGNAWLIHEFRQEPPPATPPAAINEAPPSNAAQPRADAPRKRS